MAMLLVGESIRSAANSSCIVLQPERRQTVPAVAPTGRGRYGYRLSGLGSYVHHASNYTYACATPRQTTADWISAQVQALEFIGGVPRLIVPDQTRSLIKTPDRYDPEPNRTYDEFAKHYSCALLAARPAHPRDKALTSYCTSFRRLDGD